MQCFLRKLKQKNFFIENRYDKYYSSGSAPARIYATLEMPIFSSNDTFPKLCPIVSSTGAFNYDLPRFFCDPFSPTILHNYSCKDSFSFVSQIKNTYLSSIFFVSYDITSYFTYILLQKTIDIAINLIFNHNPNLNIIKRELLAPALPNIYI